ncbi:MAG: glycosyltransferase family 9 protein, partial [Deltaproteobacteria bacterium]|nr:glycosyltransferase family 9 protein [Deltaproteobacteria bacterium]
LQKKGFEVVVVGGKKESKIASDIAGQTKCKNMAGFTSLEQTASVLNNVQLLITGDSSVLHLAAIFGIPTLSLFGPSNPLKWAPRGKAHQYLYKQLDCAPCARHGHIPPCPHGLRCLDSITPKDVLDTAFKILDKEGT